LDRISIKCFAKINLFLKVLGQRADGYHEICTLLQAVDLYDELALSKRPVGIRVKSSSEAIPLGEKNLAYRAVKLLERECRRPLGVELSIDKKIPVSAGLGGGSSDAAGTLLGMNELYGLGLSKKKLQQMSSQLGSDVPFFFSRGQAVATGRGEKIKEIALPRDYFLVLVSPSFGVPSEWAYEKAKKDLTTATKLDNILKWKDIDTIEEIIPFLENDLEAGVISEFGEVGRLKGLLSQKGALLAQMSGSGSAVYGIFNREALAEEVASSMSGEVREIFVTRPVLLH
jgi:4-diphosphocytidyl-2-C-methyl-D-erythritol kinase